MNIDWRAWLLDRQLGISLTTVLIGGLKEIVGVIKKNKDSFSYRKHTSRRSVRVIFGPVG
jgi:hypothetical protein